MLFDMLLNVLHICLVYFLIYKLKRNWLNKNLKFFNFWIMLFLFLNRTLNINIGMQITTL